MPMSESYRAICSDYYVNQKLSLKMELPRGRETVLELFERVRRQFPTMATFRRFRDELSLESPQTETPHRWVSVRGNTVRSGAVNPATLGGAHSIHQHVLEVAPYYLNISPLDVDYIELLFGFDLAAPGNHDEIVFEALLAGSPLGRLLETPGVSLIDCQPLVGLAVGQRGDLEVHFEVKTRAGSQQPLREGDPATDPISVYLTLRKFGAVSDVKELATVFNRLAQHGEELVDSRLVPTVLIPIREAIS
jgi:hypothetical protein